LGCGLAGTTTLWLATVVLSSRIATFRIKNSPQLKHLRCPLLAMAFPRSGRKEELQWPLARPHAKCEENEKTGRRRRVKNYFGRKSEPKKMHVHSGLKQTGSRRRSQNIECFTPIEGDSKVRYLATCCWNTYL
jgi:hypothetical protein